ncbi:Paired amphipathic helix protein Sin3-like 1 [Hibiscus syriacus]|uniref:Paired amphipathic helix protein Sin3-like 1 n=1 Tax=Hibiscus syriacus TaxID=106335 RepID=A0A6A3BMP6_HIBSY|nr:paired amphipathic helix protein Sin3-like 2 isoform X2 [Hibiscus syriacus]KAE8717151.1 Paired amphipathic helix protein Sin3-like 1 [Hibiscus syriacus]
MKRARDDIYSGSQFKRPFSSSRAESYGQNQMPGGSSGPGGGGVEGGGGEGGGGSMPQKLTTNDALTYLKEVKEMFQDQKEKYDMFLEVMKDFKAQRTDTVGVIARVKELFKGHNNLIYGFNTFLPKGYGITLDEDETPPRKTVEFDEAISFVNKIKKRFQHDEHVYKSFLDILNMYRREHKDLNEVYTEVASLFEDHPDLLEEFTRFLPDSSAAPMTQQVPYDRNLTQRYNERSSATPSLRHIQMDKQRRRDRIITSHPDRDLSADRPELDDDKSMMKIQKEIQKEQRKRMEKDNGDQRIHDHDDPKHENNRDFNSHRFADKKRYGRKVEGFASCDERDTFKSMCNRGFVFCEKVKERLCSSDDYQAFLKCLNIYSNGIIKRNDLQNLVTDLLGKYPDLMNEFNKFLERCENTDGLLAGVISRKSLTLDGHTSRPLEEKDREPKREIEGAKEKERYKEYMGKSIQELDLSNCQNCTPSYRLLPDDYPIPVASQRSELGASVLNDYWVSVTSGSEDYSFKHMRRNQYEESLFRCEDDRFELDMLLEAVSSTAKRVEDLLNSINENKINMNCPFRVEEHFTVLNLRCTERLYGDHGLDVMETLRKNPAIALPVILTRLKQKQEEWTKCRSDFNKVWAEIYSKNHYKSLDHRSFYFKQQDSKNLSAKSLLAEIKELKEKNQKEDDVLMASVAGHRQPLASHLEYEYLNVDIHEDLYKLIEYSCEEMCSTKEQLNRVMRLWTTLLEPMFGVPPRLNGREGTDGAGKAQNPAVNCTALNVAESDGSPGADATVNSGQLKAASDGDKNSSSELTNSCRNDLTNGETLTRERDSRDDSRLEKETKFTADKKPGIHMHANGMETVNNHSRNNVEGASGKGIAASRPSSRVAGEAHESEANADLVHSSEGVGVTKHALLVNGMPTDGSNASRCHEESAGFSRVEKEDGELSPNGEFEEDNFVAYGDTCPKVVYKAKRGVESRQHQSGNGKDLHSVDADGENDADADDEDSENASEAGDNASGSESAGDECFREENEEEEEVEHDEVDGKAESEGEAEGTADTHVGGDGTSLSFSEHFLFTVKPLSKHVRAVLPEDDSNNSWVFYANDDFYVLFRLHQILYERILSAKTNTAAAEIRCKHPKDAISLDLYASFMGALYNLLDGSTDNSKFEDECRAIIGNQSYVLFTLDKLIFKLVKQLQAVAADGMDNKLLQLFDYEKSRKHWKAMDSVYYENARVLLHEENIYRLKYSSPPSRLSIQLMDNVIEKPEAFSVSMEPNFSAVLHDDFLSVYPGKKEPHGIILKRNKKYANLDEFAATCLAMEGVELFNGLENKIACNSYKISYVLDTEDFFYRRRTSSRHRSSCNNQARIQRFHRFLSSSK